MKEFFHSPFFYIGLVIKIFLIFLISPVAVTDWYGPFLDNSIIAFSSDPWFSWLENTGSLRAFPYGYAMWLTFLPFTILSNSVGLPIEYGYQLTLLICDFALLCVLNRILAIRTTLVLFAYWLSPVVIIASYGLGLNDVVPALYLMLAILCLNQQQLRFTGVFYALAVSAKLSMLIVFPFLIIYLYNNKPLRQLIYDFALGFIVTMLFVGLPFLLSSSGMIMLTENQEMLNILGLSFEVGKEVVIYLLPICFIAIVYYVWRAKRLNFDLFMAISGVVFLVIVILMPTVSGWFVWTIPFLVFYQAMSGRGSVVIISVFSGLYVLSTLIKEKFYLFNGSMLDISSQLGNSESFMPTQLVAVIDTGIFAIGLILAIRMWREAVNDNDFFRISRQPFVVGIAGDSGAGKDTFSDSISGLFGHHSIVTLSGDNYHLWDRHKPMWQAMTHLNPMSNDLEGFSRDLTSLTDGKFINTRFYDHQSGKMGKHIKIKSNDFIIASGLHALYLPQLRACYNLMIYLDIDEDLRRYFKIKRDVEVRGHSLEGVLALLESRESDSNRFIRSQKKYADLVLSLKPIDKQALNNPGVDISRQLKVVAITRNGLSELLLHRVLVGFCGLHVDMIVSNDGSELSMTVEGEVSSADIAMAAKIICPNIFEFFDINPKWCDGVSGIMQLIAVSHINQILTKNLIK